MHNEVEKFIKKFRGDNLDISDEEKNKWIEFTIKKYINGYCYYFAKILQAAFQRGDVVILAPYGHFMWRDCDGEMYDIRGKYDGSHHTEYECEIEEEYLGNALKNFLHREGYADDTTKEDIKQLIEEAKERNRNKSELKADKIVELYAKVLERLRNSGQYYSAVYINLYSVKNKLAATTFSVYFKDYIHPSVDPKAVRMCKEMYNYYRDYSIDFSYYMNEGGRQFTGLEGSLDEINSIDDKYKEQKISIVIKLVGDMTKYDLYNYNCSVTALKNGIEYKLPTEFKEEVTDLLFPLDNVVDLKW